MRTFCLTTLLLACISLYGQSPDYLLVLDGVNGYLNAGDPASGVLDFDSSQSFSIHAWINTCFTPDKFQCILSKRRAPGGHHHEGYTLAVNSEGVVYFSIEDQKSQFSQGEGSILVNDGNWHFVSLVRDVGADSVKLFVDGTLDLAVQDNSISSLDSYMDLYIGRWHYYGRYFEGMIDDVSYWDFAMDSTGIQNLMNGALPGNPSSMLAYWDFDEGTGTKAYDQSSNAVPANLINGASWMDVLQDTVACCPSRFILSQPWNVTIAPTGDAYFVLSDSMPGSVFQWQWSGAANGNFVNVLDTGQYTGSQTQVLKVANVNWPNDSTFIRVLVKSPQPCFDTSRVVVLKIDTLASPIEEGISQEIQLYPNPSAGRVKIVLPWVLKGEVKLYDLHGRMVLRKALFSDQIDLDLQSLESRGLYHVIVQDQNGTRAATVKLIYR